MGEGCSLGAGLWAVCGFHQHAPSKCLCPVGATAVKKLPSALIITKPRLSTGKGGNLLGSTVLSWGPLPLGLSQGCPLPLPECEGVGAALLPFNTQAPVEVPLHFLKPHAQPGSVINDT